MVQLICESFFTLSSMQKNLKSFLISVYIWAFILISMMPLFLLYFILWGLCFPFDREKAVTHYYTFLWTRLYLIINPFWGIRLKNAEKINRAKKYILISNHQSLIDIALLLQLKVNFKWVSKIELAKVPFVGWVIWLNDHILVRRGDKQSVVQMAEACKRTLTSGTSIFMFPEGTRTGNGDLQPFKEGAFILARDNDIPILPIVLDGSGQALPRKGFWFRVKQTFTVSVLDEISTETLTSLNLPQLVAHTRNKMEQELVNIRNENRK
jgi:1-acyl-sn-glycerol-3-phosphate acyltransferase